MAEPEAALAVAAPAAGVGRMIDLTEPWAPDAWPYPGHPSSSESMIQTMPVDRINSWLVATSMHTGTHVDGPLHCAPRGSDMASIPLDRLVRPGYVVDLREVVSPWYVLTPEDVEAALPGPVSPGDALMLRYGWQRFNKNGEERDADTFFNRHPGPGRALVEWMIEKDVAWIGTDSPSFEHPANISLRKHRPDLIEEMRETIGDAEPFDDSTWMMAHRLMLAREQLHLDQGGGDLHEVPAERVTLGIFPWKYRGGEASICRLVAFC
ncbi:MAG: cyclase family protein [Solirubrobacterales bacterium]